MTILVGLGNPGEKYLHSRHNLGFVVLETLQKTLDLGPWTQDKTAQAQTIRAQSVVLVKPQTFMNRSGDAVKAVLKKYDYPALSAKTFPNLFVVYDDLDLEVGKYKLVFGSGPKDHNGVNHIKAVLATDQFWHIRIGVDGRKGERSIEPEEYVLSGFTKEEQILIDKVIESVVELLTQKISNE